MPTVPRATSPTVNTRPLPIPQYQGASPGEFGAQLGQGVANLGLGIAQYQQARQDEADAVRLTAAQKQLDDVEHSLVFDPQNGALTKRGLNALPVYDETLKAFDDQTGELAKGLGNDRQRKVFQGMVAQRRGAVGNVLERHTSQEVERADAAESAAAVDSAVSMGAAYYNDPSQIAAAQQRGEAVIRSRAARFGAGPEATDQQLSTFRSALHTGVIERALANPDVMVAPLAQGPDDPPGLKVKGNIDLGKRPVVKNADGSISTVRSMSFEEDGQEILVPTVAADGSKILSDEEAIAQYHATGQFLGKFDTAAHATAYAKDLHEQQAKAYSGQPISATEYAKDYLNAHRSEIVGDQLARLEASVNQGSDLAQGFAEADRIYRDAPDRKAAREMIAAIKDPQVRQHAQAELNQKYNEADSDAKVAEDQLFEHASDRLPQLGSLSRLQREMGADWKKLNHNSVMALRAYAEQLTKKADGVPAKTDFSVWTDFLQLPPKEMAAVNPMRDLREHLSDSDLEQATKMIVEARQGKPSALAAEGMGFEQRVESAARGAGVVPAEGTSAKWSGDQKLAYDALRGRAERALMEAETAKGSKLDVEEKQAVMDRLTVKLKLDRSFRRDIDVLASDVPTDDMGDTYVPAGSIPGEDRVRLSKVIVDAGGEVSERKVERIAAVLTLSSLGRITRQEAADRIAAIARAKP